MLVIKQQSYGDTADYTLDLCGRKIPSPESSHRVAQILSGLHGSRTCSVATARGLGGLERNQFEQALRQTHSTAYLEFLGAVTEGHATEFLEHPYTCPYNEPETFVSQESWRSSIAAAEAAFVAAADFGKSREDIYVLSRPPGHHAGFGWMGGFCYLNNTALAANVSRNLTNANVGILDLDFHYGNGIADIVRRGAGLCYASLHCDRMQTYPFYKDASDAECRSILTIDYAEPPQIERYLDDMERCVAFLIDECDCRSLIVAMGYDTVANDPFGGWNFVSGDFQRIARRLRESCRQRLLIVQEGGYNIASLPDCARSFAAGLSDWHDR